MAHARSIQPSARKGEGKRRRREEEKKKRGEKEKKEEEKRGSSDFCSTTPYLKNLSACGGHERDSSLRSERTLSGFRPVFAAAGCPAHVDAEQRGRCGIVCGTQAMPHVPQNLHKISCVVCCSCSFCSLYMYLSLSLVRHSLIDFSPPLTALGYFGAILSHTTIGDAGAKILIHGSNKSENKKDKISNGITTFMQSVCSQREPEPVTMQQLYCPTPECDGAQPKQSYCLHGAPPSSLHGTSRAPT